MGHGGFRKRCESAIGKGRKYGRVQGQKVRGNPNFLVVLRGGRMGGYGLGGANGLAHPPPFGNNFPLRRSLEGARLKDRVGPYPKQTKK